MQETLEDPEPKPSTRSHALIDKQASQGRGFARNCQFLVAVQDPARTKRVDVEPAVTRAYNPNDPLKYAASYENGFGVSFTAYAA